jgi:thiol-disulfide isomerase/thioredoxin
MNSRRSFLVSAAALALAAAAPARAFEILPYEADAAQKAIASGEPVIVHVYASWCLQCHAQASILDNLKANKAYDGVKFYRVDYDGQKDVVAKLNCPRSTVIAYKGGKEVARMSWGMSQDSVVKVLDAAL